ncbi:hypothetical protein [Acinetobacter lactucae]|uniref:hypothetical protein n=1 Tax=Acinetobacter lactucae TaxID=1785128 RepID=UPI001D184E23|nr:hypothetical protein [Acinetobacter lactucae]
MTLNNPETIEIHGLKTIHKLCNFAADRDMEGCTFTEIVERMFAELEKAKAQVVPETHILVEKTKIETWWQGAEEPENFASGIEDLPSLGHYLTGDEIMEITEHHTIHLPSKTIYGVWVEKDGDRSFCTGTMEECLALTASESGAEG